MTKPRLARVSTFWTALLLAFVSASSASALPNLTPYRPSGWSDKIVVSNAAQTNSDTTLTPTDTLYVDSAVINNGSSAATARFFTQIYVDGSLRTSWYLDPPLDPEFYAYFEDYSIGSLPAGTHTIRIKTDSTGVIAESNERDNEYTKTIVVTGAQPCTPGPDHLCLNDGRFKAQVNWRVPSQGTSGIGTAVSLTSDTGYFWFFNDTNVELVIKVLDGRGFNGKFWVFYGALSDVEYTMTVTDTATGSVKSYFNPQGRIASVADTSAFGSSGGAFTSSVANLPDGEPPISAPADGSGVAVRDLFDASAEQPWGISPAADSLVAAEASAPCVPSSAVLCLNGNRFAVQVAWRVPSQGTSGIATAVPLTGDTGYFWFFSNTNVELVIKVLDGRPVNGKFWVFYGALSDVEYRIRLTDTATGVARTYFNPSSRLASVADTAAFSPAPLTSLETTSQTIPRGRGGALTLPSGSRVSVPTGTFATDQAVTLSRLPLSETTQQDYFDTTALLDAGPPANEIFVVDTGFAATQAEVSLSVKIPEDFLNSLGRSYMPQLFVKAFWQDDQESLDPFEPVSSHFDPLTRTLTAVVPDWGFVNVRNPQGTYECIVLVGSLPASSPASAPRITDLDSEPCTTNLYSPIRGLTPAALRISSNFGRRYHPLAKKYLGHAGADIAVPTGTEIVAAQSGWIIFIGFNDNGTTGYGQYVIVEHDDGSRSTYAHLKTGTIKEADDRGICYPEAPCSSLRSSCKFQPISAATCGLWLPKGKIPVEGGKTLIGLSDSTGRVTRAHLHFEYETKKDKKLVDPVPCVTLLPPGGSPLLTLTKLGNGFGAVASSPPGIVCGPNCSVVTKSFPTGTEVTLSAVEESGSRFDRWSGCGPLGPNSCVVTMTSDIAVTASFSRVSGACTYSIGSPPARTFESSGGTGSVSVTTAGGCPWTAKVHNDSVSWITITSGTSGSGNGTVGYSVATNASTSQRTGTMTIAGLTFTVTEAGTAIQPPPPPPASSGTFVGSFTGFVTDTVSFPGCSFRDTVNATTITANVTGGSGTLIDPFDGTFEAGGFFAISVLTGAELDCHGDTIPFSLSGPITGSFGKIEVYIRATVRDSPVTLNVTNGVISGNTLTGNIRIDLGFGPPPIQGTLTLTRQ